MADINDHIGFFKAEEYTNFVLWCLPFVLDKLGIEKYSVLGSLDILLTEIGRFFSYIHGGMGGLKTT